MPALHALGQHPALQAASATLLPGETVFAYLDDAYAVCPPERVRAVAGVARVVLQEHAGIEVHLGKTRIWNAAGEEPAGTSALQGPGGADVWVGAWTLPPERRAPQCCRRSCCQVVSPADPLLRPFSGRGWHPASPRHLAG